MCSCVRACVCVCASGGSLVRGWWGVGGGWWAGGGGGGGSGRHGSHADEFSLGTVDKIASHSGSCARPCPPLRVRPTAPGRLGV